MENTDEFHYAEDRDQRVKDTAEVFTPPVLINKMLDDIGYDWDNHDHSKTWLDPTGGSGNFLVELAKRGIELKNLYSAELMQDNVETIKRRLREIYGDTAEVNKILNNNIVEADALTYSYWFDDDMDLFRW